MLKSVITDGNGGDYKLKVQPEGTINAVIHPNFPFLLTAIILVNFHF